MGKQSEEFYDKLQTRIESEFSKGTLMLFCNAKINSVASIIATALEAEFQKIDKNEIYSYNKLILPVTELVRRRIKLGDLITDPRSYASDILSNIICAMRQKQIVAPCGASW